MFDLILRGGTVVTPHGTDTYDVAVSGETIAAVTNPGAIDETQANRTVDVAGKIVVPGGIDPHVHCKWHMPLPGGGVGYTEGPEVVSRAALYGAWARMRESNLICRCIKKSSSISAIRKTKNSIATTRATVLAFRWWNIATVLRV